MPVELLSSDKLLDENDYTVIREKGVTRRYTEEDRARLGQAIRGALRPSPNDARLRAASPNQQASQVQEPIQETIKTKSRSPLARFFSKPAARKQG